MPTLERSEIPRDSLLRQCRELPRWICWARHRDPFKSHQKIPLDTSTYLEDRGEFRECNHRLTEFWMWFDDAFEKCREHDEIDGVGFIVKDTPYCYVDIDACVQRSTLTVDEEAYSLVEGLKSYTEISTGGGGLHIIGEGDPSSYGWSKDSDLSVEVWDESWVAITLDHVEGTPITAVDIREPLLEVCDRYEIDTHGGLDFNSRLR